MALLLELFSSKIFLVVWREAFEALLIIGILYGFLKKSKSENGLKAMWIGILGGLGFSALAAWVFIAADSLLDGMGQVYFEVVVMSLGAFLMTHMVFWMRRHGRYIKRNLENGLGKALEEVNWLAIALLCGVAVLREGVETVVFIYGLSFELQGNWSVIAFSSLAGLGGSLVSFWVIAKGLTFLQERHIFKLTEWILLLAASGLAVTVAGKLVAEGLVSPLVNQLWNLESLIPMSSAVGNVLSTWFGYNSRPTLLEVLFYFGYWLVIFVLINPMKLRFSIGIRKKVTA